MVEPKVRTRRKKILGIVIVIVVSLATVPAILLGSFSLRVQRFEADSKSGFHADFYLYVSPGARHAAKSGELVTLLVQPNNSGINSDDPEVHLKDAWWTSFGRHGIADELNVVLLVPAFLRPSKDWKIYTHALDRDVLTTIRSDLARLDLQLLAMVDHARTALQAEGIATDPKILIQGFSASGMFANRFAALHPNRVKAVAAGSPGGWPIAPASISGGEPLPFPAGVADLEELIGQPFDSLAYQKIPQLIIMGSLDDNDAVDFSDGWEDEHAAILDRLFGEDPLSRWKHAESLYRKAGADARFLLVDGVGHDRKALQKYTTRFFAEVLVQPSGIGRA